VAIDISERYVEDHTRGPTQAALRTIIALAPAIRAYRKLLRWLTRDRTYESVSECRITESLDKCASHFQEHRWALVENFFSGDFHAELMAQWPGRHEFYPPRTLNKSYDTGLAWVGPCDAGPPGNIRKYAALVKLRAYLCSAEFSRRISQVHGGRVNLQCERFLMHMTRRGSQVVPHRDTYYRSKHPALNILMFVDGQDGGNGGGLAISRDNELKDVVVEARNLKNSALLYDVKADFFHGFKPVGKGKIRRSMAAEFKGRQIEARQPPDAPRLPN
jgi:hypothetical protein